MYVVENVYFVFIVDYKLLLLDVILKHKCKVVQPHALWDKMCICIESETQRIVILSLCIHFFEKLELNQKFTDHTNQKLIKFDLKASIFLILLSFYLTTTGCDYYVVHSHWLLNLAS